MSGMATPPESTKYSLHHRLAAHARQRWPQVADCAGGLYLDNPA